MKVTSCNPHDVKYRSELTHVQSTFGALGIVSRPQLAACSPGHDFRLPRDRAPAISGSTWRCYLSLCSS